MSEPSLQAEARDMQPGATRPARYWLTGLSASVVYGIILWIIQQV